MDKKDGVEKARAVADKLREEIKVEEEQKEQALIEAKNQLALVRQNSSLSAMYEKTSQEEMRESLGAQPLLKLHVAGRSHNILLDGTQPEDGSFFYVPTQEAFKNPSIHLMVMSDGFYAEGLPDDSGKPKIVYNILVGGTIIADGSMRPFIMYITSQAIRQSFWEFRNEINKYARLMRVPKFALSVKMESGKVANPNPKWAKANPFVNNITFSIDKVEDGSPVVITDEGEFMALVDMQAMLREMVDSIIAAKKVEKPVIKRIPCALLHIFPTAML
jgi:hypothetical protein